MHAAPAQQSCSLLGSSILCCCPRASAPSLSPLVPISPHHDHRLMIITVIIIFVSPALASFLPLLSHSIPSSSLLARLSRSLSSREQHRQHARSQSVKEGERAAGVLPSQSSATSGVLFPESGDREMDSSVVSPLFSPSSFHTESLSYFTLVSSLSLSSV